MTSRRVRKSGQRQRVKLASSEAQTHNILNEAMLSGASVSLQMQNLSLDEAVEKIKGLYLQQFGDRFILPAVLNDDANQEIDKQIEKLKKIYRSG